MRRISAVALVENMRRWWQIPTVSDGTRRFRDVAAWMVSLLIHLSALVALASLTLLVPVQQREVYLSPQLEVRNSEEILPPEFHFSAEPQERMGVLGIGGVSSAEPAAPVAAEESRVAYDVPQSTTIADMQAIEFDRTIVEGPRASDGLPIQGMGSIGTSGAAGAVDRITHEILLSLEKRPTLIVWLFDQSGSLKPQREAIAKRFDRVYKELGAIEASGNSAFTHHKEKPLLTTVAQFGSSIELLIPKPTDELPEIQAAVRSIKDDERGKGLENVFQSVRFLADKFRHFRLANDRRNVMIVVFTDEAGDDIDQLDSTVDLCRKYEMPVYVVGVPAPFGRDTAFVTYIDPDPKYDQSPQRAPVHQGPESLLPERIKLLFGGREEYEEQVDSGFGPFGLCRLAYETGGLYFTVHPNREVGKKLNPWETAAMSSQLVSFFDPLVMRSYRPDYVSVRQYRELLSSNRACSALVEAAQLSWTTQMENVRLNFPKQDESQLARDLSIAQQNAAKIEPQLEQLVNVLRQGEKDRPKVTKPRWQAGFDLAIGRALAVKVRTEGYNAMLAEAKQGLTFKNEKSDTWELKPSDKVTVNSTLTKDAADARLYLERVVKDHQGTPWAMDAAEELRQPMGWEWKERFTDVAGRMARAEGNQRPRPEKPPEPQKPRRDPPAL